MTHTQKEMNEEEEELKKQRSNWVQESAGD
jgi:hypothetical protein